MPYIGNGSMFLGNHIVTVQNKGIVYEGDNESYARIAFGNFVECSKEYINWSCRGVVVKTRAKIKS